MEDHDEINRLLQELFVTNHYQVKAAYSGTEGLSYFEQEDFDLVLLDLMLPGMDGYHVLEKMREHSNVPVIVISAKTQVDDKLKLFQIGADDYITKPFDIREVLARVELQLKKSSRAGHSHLLVWDELALDETLHKFFVNDRELVLTRQEFNIMRVLMKYPEKVFSKQELFELAWEQYYVGEDKTINVHVSNIRNKLKSYTEKEYIRTVWGIGFQI